MSLSRASTLYLQSRGSIKSSMSSSSDDPQYVQAKLQRWVSVKKYSMAVGYENDFDPRGPRRTTCSMAMPWLANQ